MKNLKQKELRTFSKRSATIVALLCITILLVLVWFVFNAQLEHRNRHYAEESPNLHNLEIKELEEVVRIDPQNFSAWKLLGLKYRHGKNYVKAKESWKRALEVAHTDAEVTWLKEKLGHIDGQHK